LHKPHIFCIYIAIYSFFSEPVIYTERGYFPSLAIQFVKVIFMTYCYETIIFQYAIVTDKAGVQPIGCRLGPRPRDKACG